MHSLKILIESKYSHILYHSMRPEAMPNAKVDFSLDKNNFIINIKAKNISSLRAAANSFIIWSNMLEQLLEHA